MNDRLSPGFFRLPLEIRLEIYRLVHDCGYHDVCSHQKLPYLVLTGHPSGNMNRVRGLSLLAVNRQINAEMGDSFIIYLERIFTHHEHHLCFMDREILGRALVFTKPGPDMWHLVRRIGFSVNEEPDYGRRPRHWGSYQSIIIANKRTNVNIGRLDHGLKWVGHVHS